MRYLLALTITTLLFSIPTLAQLSQDRDALMSTMNLNGPVTEGENVDGEAENRNLGSNHSKISEKSAENTHKIRELEIAHDYIDKEISGLSDDISRQLTYSTIIVGATGLILTGIAMFYVVPTFWGLQRKQAEYKTELDEQAKEYKSKLEKIERDSQEKLDKVVEQEYDWSRSIREHLRDVSQINASTNLVIAVVEKVSVIYGAEAVVNRAYRQTEKVDKLLERYRNSELAQNPDCMEEEADKKAQIEREALSQWITETIDEGESFCDEAANKIREAERQQDVELHHKDKLLSIRNDIKKKLDDLRIRTAVAKGLLYKRKFDLTGKRVPDLQFAIQSLQTVTSQLNDSTTRNAKAKVYYNLACYQCLNGEPESAKDSLKLAVEFNGRYELSAKLDNDLALIRKEIM